MMGSGKSSIGRLLAENLGYRFIELDKLILNHTGYASVQAVFADKISIWKEAEIALSKDLSSSDNQVIACGGGFLDNELNLTYFAESRVDYQAIYLYSDEKTLASRVHARSKRVETSISAPAKITKHKITKNIAGIFPQRDAKYRLHADHVVSTETNTIDETCQEIIELLHR
jgi:shikimate kinase